MSILNPLAARVSWPISMLSTISATAARPLGRDQQGIGLDDVHLGLQKRGADFQERLRAVGQFQADQIGFHDGQSGPFQDLPALLGMAEHEAGKCAFSGVRDGDGHDLYAAGLETTNNFEQLSYPILKKNCKLPNCGIIAAPHG